MLIIIKYVKEDEKQGIEKTFYQNNFFIIFALAQKRNHYGKKIQYIGYLRPKETLYGGRYQEDEGF